MGTVRILRIPFPMRDQMDMSMKDLLICNKTGDHYELKSPDDLIRLQQVVVPDGLQSKVKKSKV